MLETVILGLTFVGGIWYLLSVGVLFTSVALVGLILLQDSKDSGLTSAFGGGGSASLMGARMQKDLAKMTGVLGAVLAICLFIMGLIGAKTSPSAAAVDAVPPPADQPEPPPSPTEGGNLLDGILPGGGLSPVPGGGFPSGGSSTPPAPGQVPGGATTSATPGLTPGATPAIPTPPALPPPTGSSAGATPSSPSPLPPTPGK